MTSSWWPILEDVVGIAGDESLHAVDAWSDRNKDKRRPFSARCGVVVWKLYGCTGEDGVIIMPWPPKITVAKRGYPHAVVCADCRRLGRPKKVLGTWNNVREAEHSEAS